MGWTRTVHDIGSISIMPPTDDWSGDERRLDRRRILERRREARQEERDRQAEEAARAGTAPPVKTRGPDRRKADRRIAQICFVCHEEFSPKKSGQTVCDRCHMDGVRGGGRNGWRAPRF